MNHNYIVAFRRGFSNSYKKQIECQNWWLQWLISITLGSWWIYAVRPFKIRRIIVEFLFRFKTLLFLFFSPFVGVFRQKLLKIWLFLCLPWVHIKNLCYFRSTSNLIDTILWIFSLVQLQQRPSFSSAFLTCDSNESERTLGTRVRQLNEDIWIVYSR
jgi:hypothetical protein